MSSGDAVLDLERELQAELAALDHIFFTSTTGDNDNGPDYASDGDIEYDDYRGRARPSPAPSRSGPAGRSRFSPSSSFSSGGKPRRSTVDARSTKRYTEFDLAEAEIEREALQDKLRLLLGKTEDFDERLLSLHDENQLLQVHHITPHSYYALKTTRLLTPLYALFLIDALCLCDARERVPSRGTRSTTSRAPAATAAAAAADEAF